MNTMEENQDITRKQATKLVIGCGYLGERVAARWRQAGDRVLVATRRAERVPTLVAAGYECQTLDVTLPETLAQLPPLDTLLFAVAYDPQGRASREAVLVDGLRNVLDAIPDLTDRCILISTTGVYGQRDGQWVDEQSLCTPQRVGGQCYVAAERVLREHRWGDRAMILRLAGIYGPRRVPYLDRLRAGQPLPVESHGYLNLIHVVDAVSAILASELAAVPGLYVVADGSPVLRADYYREVACYVGGTPSFTAPDPNSPQGQRGRTSKRICNRKLIRELRIHLAYPSYREGLAAILTDENGS